MPSVFCMGPGRGLQAGHHSGYKCIMTLLPSPPSYFKMLSEGRKAIDNFWHPFQVAGMMHTTVNTQKTKEMFQNSVKASVSLALSGDPNEGLGWKVHMVGCWYCHYISL